MLIREIKDSSEKRAIIECCDKSFIRPLTTRNDFEGLFSKIDNYAFFFAIFNGHNPIGYSVLYANDAQTKVGYISIIAVLNNMQNKHVGSALMQKCIETSAEKGMTYIRLEVLKNNESAILFYERWGFKYERDCSDESIYMIKQLT